MMIRIMSGNLQITERSLFRRSPYPLWVESPEYHEFMNELMKYKEEGAYIDPYERDEYANRLYDYRWDLMVAYYNRMGGNTGDQTFDSFMSEAIAEAELEAKTGLG